MRTTAVMSIALLMVAGRLEAQEQAPARDPGWLIGFSVGLPGYGTETIPQLFTMGAQFTQLSPNRLDADISVGTMPWLFGSGLAALGLRAGLALPIAATQHLLILPSGGVSAIGGASSGGVGAAFGINGGVAAVVLGNSNIGLRTGVTFHHFQGARGALWLAELGVVSVPATFP